MLDRHSRVNLSPEDRRACDQPMGAFQFVESFGKPGSDRQAVELDPVAFDLKGACDEVEQEIGLRASGQLAFFFEYASRFLDRSVVVKVEAGKSVGFPPRTRGDSKPGGGQEPRRGSWMSSAPPDN